MGLTTGEGGLARAKAAVLLHADAASRSSPRPRANDCNAACEHSA